MRKICVVNKKGGVGKTTSLLGIARILGRLGHKVLILDTDGQGNCSNSLGIPAESFEHGLHSLFTNQSNINNCIYPSNLDNVDVVPCDLRFDYWKDDLINRMETDILRNKLKDLKNGYDFLLIDTAPSTDRVLNNILNISNDLKIIVPVTTEGYSVNGIDSLYRLLQRKMPNTNFAERLKILPNKVNLSEKSINKKFKEKLDMLPKSLFFSTWISKDVQIADCQYEQMGIPARSKTHSDFSTVVKEIIAW